MWTNLIATCDSEACLHSLEVSVSFWFWSSTVSTYAPKAVSCVLGYGLPTKESLSKRIVAHKCFNHLHFIWQQLPTTFVNCVVSGVGSILLSIWQFMCEHGADREYPCCCIENGYIELYAKGYLTFTKLTISYCTCYQSRCPSPHIWWICRTSVVETVSKWNL